MAAGKRKYGFSRTELKDPATGELYMTRWVFQTPWGAIRLHKIWRSDQGRDFHDHPFDFTSLILWGGYVEHRPGCACAEFNDWPGMAELRRLAGTRDPVVPDPCAYYGPGSIVRRRAEDLHRLELSRPAWTLVIAGPYRREWGFQTGQGWVPASKYHVSYYAPKEKP